jgi:hypothetical protein
MITAQQIKEKLAIEKDPLQYIDGEIARHACQMEEQCGFIKDILSDYNHRVNENDEIDMQKLKEDLIKTGELYWELNLYVKARKEQVKRQKRAEQLNKALVKRQKSVDQKNRIAPDD